MLGFKQRGHLVVCLLLLFCLLFGNWYIPGPDQLYVKLLPRVRSYVVIVCQMNQKKQLRTNHLRNRKKSLNFTMLMMKKRELHIAILFSILS